MKFKVGDYVTRIGPEEPFKTCGIGETHKITQIKGSQNQILHPEDPSTFYYMLISTKDGENHSAWENQLEHSAIVDSPLWQELK